MEVDEPAQGGAGHPENAIETPAPRGRGRPKGSKNKAKDVPVNHAAYSMNGGDLSMNYGDGAEGSLGAVKRGRGRPKGSKNKPGHKAGRPRKSGAEEGEDGSPAIKRQRTQSPNPSNAPALTQTQQQQQGRPLPPPVDEVQADIPVDPSLMSGQRSDHNAVAPQADTSAHYNRNFTLPAGTEIPSAEATSAAVAYSAREGTMPVHGQNAVASGSSSTKVDKGKGVAVEEDVSLSSAIHDLLPKDSGGNVPLVSGPFQLVEKDGKRRLEGPVEAASMDTNAGPVYVYIANFQPAQGEEATPGFAPWKITHPLTSEGKDRVRGPRRCGHCGKMECRGRGGRTWCPEYQEGAPGILPAKARSPAAAKEEDEDQLALSGATGSRARGQVQRTFSTLSNFRGDEGTPSTSSNGQHGFDLSAGDSGDRISESVTLLIQSILPQSRVANAEEQGEDHEIFGPAYAEGYSDPGAPSSSVAPYAPGVGLYGSSDAGESGKKARQPRHCVLCGKAECPGKTQRSRCKEFVAESLVVNGEDE